MGGPAGEAFGAEKALGVLPGGRSPLPLPEL